MKRSMRLISAVFFSASVISFSTAGNANAQSTITFHNSDSFDGDVAGSVAGPFVDLTSLVSGMITTASVVPGGSLVNTTPGRLGVDAPGTGDTANSFDNLESWVFFWDCNSQFAGINFGDYSTTSENMGFSVQSSAWVGLSISPGSANVVFNSATGAFSFNDSAASDVFTAASLYGTGPIPTVSAGTAITIGYIAGTTDNAYLQRMTFNLSAVPEPSTLAMVGLGGLVMLALRRKNA